MDYGFLAGIALILAALGKILVDVRAGNRETSKVHILVDGRMTGALRTIARLSRSVARLTKDPIDEQAASEAEAELEKKYSKDEEVKSL